MSVYPSMFPFPSVSERVAENLLQFQQSYHNILLIKVFWYVLILENMHSGSPSHPSRTTAAEAKPRYVYSILKPHGQSSRLYEIGKITINFNENTIF